MTRRIALSGHTAAHGGEDGRALTAGDLSRILHVDLKTVHNWVAAGHLFGRRTAGRHLRFARASVVRFARQYGYPIPTGLGAYPGQAKGRYS